MHADGARGATILAVEDEPVVRGLVVRVLRDEGYVVIEADDALSAITRISTDVPDLVLLDVNLPDVDGLQVLSRVRRSSDVPVILLTGRADEQNRVDGLRGGADDYIVKPFSFPELLARIETVLRRTRRRVAPAPDRALGFGPLEIDLATRDVRVDGRRVELTAKEFDLLTFLARSPRQVFNREQLLQQVWGSTSEWQDAATVTEHVRRVRRKVEPDPDRPRWLHTVRGVGYRFEP